MMKPTAISTIAAKIDNEWGTYGYSIATLTEGPLLGSAVAEVWHSDGSVFYVGSDQWGTSFHADTAQALAAAMTTANDNAESVLARVRLTFGDT